MAEKSSEQIPQLDAEERRLRWVRWQQEKNPERYACEVLVPLLGKQTTLVLRKELGMSQVQTLRGVEYFTGVQHLDLSYCTQIRDLTPLSKLSQLRALAHTPAHRFPSSVQPLHQHTEWKAVPAEKWGEELQAL